VSPADAQREARMEVARREEEIRHLRTRLAEVVTNRHDRE
jgi:hypothetical protein